MGEKILCTICGKHYYEDTGCGEWDEYDDHYRAWDENPVLQLKYYGDHDALRFVSYLLDAKRDVSLLRRIKVLNPRVAGNKSFLDLPETLLLKKAPETVEEAVKLAEKYLKT